MDRRVELAKIPTAQLTLLDLQDARAGQANKAGIGGRLPQKSHYDKDG